MVIQPKLVVDTNAYTKLISGDKAVLQQLEHTPVVYVPVTVLAELQYGFINGTKATENLSILKKFLDQKNVSILDTTKETAAIYASIKHQLKKAGFPIPTNDIWIAASTIETHATLLTYDKHFSKIKNLRITKV